MNVETFYLRSGQFFNTIEIVTSEHTQTLSVTDGKSILDDEESEKKILIDFSSMNASTAVNAEELKKFAIQLIKATDKTLKIKSSDNVMNKIKTRVSNYKYLREFVSYTELVYVIFDDGTCAVIGDYVTTKTGKDCAFLDKSLPVEEIDYAIDLEGLGIKTAIEKYFLSVCKKQVVSVHLVISPELIEHFKETFYIT